MVKESERERIVDLYKSGNYSRTQIADEVGVSYSTVRRIIVKYEEEKHAEENKFEPTIAELVETNRKETKDSDMGKHYQKKKRSNKHNKRNVKSSLNNHQRSKIIEDRTKEEIKKATISLYATPVIEEKPIDDNIQVISIKSEPMPANILGFQTEGLELLNRPENVVEVGLVSDRHDMYIKNYIFTKELSEEMMFDFDKQLGECDKYIAEHITNNQTLVVYCTGLQSALGAVVRSCYKNKVNLVLKHYNSQSHTYMPQVIYDEFGDIADTSFPFDSLMRNSKSLLTYKSSLSDILKNDKFYCISFNEHQDDNRFKEKGCYYVMTDNIDKAWEIYPKLVSLSKEDSNKSRKLSVFLTTCNINPSSGFDWGENWTKSYNYYP